MPKYAANVTQPFLLPTRQHEQTLSIEAITQDLELYKVVNLDSVYPVALGDFAYGVVIWGAQIPTEFGASSTQSYATLTRSDQAVVQVEPGEVIAVGDVVTPSAGTGNVQARTLATEHPLGIALNASDGSGTLTVPHYVLVELLEQVV